ncbi:hypothetical protein G6F60_015149 [Rhizopus arrhizus]|nr:hypothetical protein G6F60_015149 [Rhizopus arrhizus]
MLAAIREHQPKVVFLAVPNNPTGGLWSDHDVQAIIAAAPGLVVLDEAYNEYLDPEPRFDSTALARRFPNRIISRTFSKAYGLAGLRVGRST